MSNRKNGALCIGAASNLKRRVREHRQGPVEGFSKRYELKRLVCFELHPTMASALQREKQLKIWKRAWKIELVQKEKPQLERSVPFAGPSRDRMERTDAPQALTML